MPGIGPKTRVRDQAGREVNLLAFHGITGGHQARDIHAFPVLGGYVGNVNAARTVNSDLDALFQQPSPFGKEMRTHNTFGTPRDRSGSVVGPKSGYTTAIYSLTTSVEVDAPAACTLYDNEAYTLLRTVRARGPESTPPALVAVCIRLDNLTVGKQIQRDLEAGTNTFPNMERAAELLFDCLRRTKGVDGKPVRGSISVTLMDKDGDTALIPPSSAILVSMSPSPSPRASLPPGLPPACSMAFH